MSILKKYFDKRLVFMNIQNAIHLGFSLEKKANKMNNSKIIKPSFKEVEEFLEDVQKLQYSLKPNEKYDIAIQNKVIQLKSLPINSLTECETFAKNFSEVALLMDKDVPIWWKGIGTTFTFTEGLILTLFIIGTTLFVVY